MFYRKFVAMWSTRKLNLHMCRIGGSTDILYRTCLASTSTILLSVVNTHTKTMDAHTPLKKTLRKHEKLQVCTEIQNNVHFKGEKCRYSDRTTWDDDDLECSYPIKL